MLRYAGAAREVFRTARSWPRALLLIVAAAGSRPGHITRIERAPSTRCKAVRSTPSGRTKNAVPRLEAAVGTS